MKPYGVMKYQDVENYAYHYDRNSRNIAYAQPVPKERTQTWERLSSEQMLWFTDTKEAAEHLAETLVQQFTGNRYVVFKSELFFQCPPGPVVKSEFTVKGLLPTT